MWIRLPCKALLAKSNTLSFTILFFKLLLRYSYLYKQEQKQLFLIRRIIPENCIPVLRYCTPVSLQRVTYDQWYKCSVIISTLHHPLLFLWIFCSLVKLNANPSLMAKAKEEKRKNSSFAVTTVYREHNSHA